MARELVKADWTEGLPEPIDLKRALHAQLDRVLGAARRDREVHVREDTWPLVRSLADAHETLQGYGAAFRDVAKTVLAEVEEELLQAVHEQDGVPLDDMTVPDELGDIKIVRDTSNVYDFDLDALVTAVATRVAVTVEAGQEDAIAMVRRGIYALLGLGKFEPQVSKVNAYAVLLGRHGDDEMASVVNSTIAKTTPYKGVKIARAVDRKK